MTTRKGESRRTTEDLIREKRKRQKKFLKKLREWGTVYEACRRCGVSTQTVYKWAATDSQFRKRMIDAKECAVQRLETSAYRKALKGDTLLTIFLLKAMRPEIYRDRYEGKIDEEELNSAIERELDRVAARRPHALPGVVEGQVRIVTEPSPPPAAGIPPADV